MKLDIRTKILLISMGIFLVVIGASTWVNGLYFNAEYSQARQSEAFVITQTLKTQLDRLLKMHIPIDQLEGFEELCQDILNEHQFISFAMVVRPDGKILFHNDPSFHGQMISSLRVLDGVKRLQKTVSISSSGDRSFYNFFVPVLGNHGEHIATIRTGFPLDIISEKTRKIAVNSAGIAAISFIIGLLLLLTGLNRWVVEPIQRFSKTIRNLNRNWADPDCRVDIIATDEIGQLATAFNRMTDELRQTTVSKDYMDNIIENMLNSLIVVDTRSTIQSVNRATLDLLGYGREELIGEKLDRILVDPSEPGKYAITNPVMSGSMTAVEASYLSRNGTAIPVLMSGSTFQDKNGQVQGFICVAQDISKLKQAEREKIKARNIAAEHKKMALVGQVAGKMAHDFNNILGGILGVSELLLLDSDDEETRESLNIIISQTLRGKNLTKNLVAFAKSHEPVQEFFNMNEKIRMVTRLMKKDLDGITLAEELSSPLPDLLADPGMIEHSLVNLIQNAIHAVSKTREPKIILRTYCTRTDIYFEIEDNGCGIPKEHLDRIYDPSFTLKGSRDRSGMYQKDIKGTGYGMSNVKKYIEQHKGHILAVSTPGTGTKFTVRLPLTHKDLLAEEKTAIQKSVVCENKTILVVEDEHAISDVQQRILTQDPFHYRVDLAETGQSAMDLFDKNQYDLISLDYVLPGNINGIDVYHHIREKDATVAILFASGNIEFLESIKELKQKDRYLDHISKPYRNIDYVSRINRLLERLGRC